MQTAVSPSKMLNHLFIKILMKNILIAKEKKMLELLPKAGIPSSYLIILPFLDQYPEYRCKGRRNLAARVTTSQSGT